MIDEPIFSESQVRYFLALAGLNPDDLSEANLSRIGVASTKTQRDRVLAAYEVNPDVEVIFEMLGFSVPKSSIRAYLSQSHPNGDWRQRRRRGTSGRRVA